ncbi:MAG: nucleoside 2-deoxyribosyltransferase [Vicinamibacterales bacterium]
MRIYLACTVRGDRAGTAAGRVICERLHYHGHEVLTTHLLADDVETAESALTEADVYRRDLEWLSSCDVLVAEASGSSYGVGFEVGYVLGRAGITGQRVLLLYNAARRDVISRLIVGNCDESCSTVEYRSMQELATLIDRQFGPVSLAAADPVPSPTPQS